MLIPGTASWKRGNGKSCDRKYVGLLSCPKPDESEFNCIFLPEYTVVLKQYHTKKAIVFNKKMNEIKTSLQFPCKVSENLAIVSVHNPNSFHFIQSSMKDTTKIHEWKVGYSMKMKYSFLMIEGMPLDENLINEVLKCLEKE